MPWQKSQTGIHCRQEPDSGAGFWNWIQELMDHDQGRMDIDFLGHHPLKRRLDPADPSALHSICHPFLVTSGSPALSLPPHSCSLSLLAPQGVAVPLVCSPALGANSPHQRCHFCQQPLSVQTCPELQNVLALSRDWAGKAQHWAELVQVCLTPGQSPWLKHTA